MDPNVLLQNLPGIGSYYANRLKKLNLITLEDLIYHFPFRYDDFSQIQKIDNLTQGEKITVQGVIWQIKNIRTRTGKFLTNAQVSDESGIIDVIWFNQPYLTKNIKAGSQISLSGKVDIGGPRPKLISPTYEILRSTQLQVQSQQNEPGKKPGFVPGVDRDKSLALNSADTTHTGRL